jgi:hypothetical protein
MPIGIAIIALTGLALTGGSDNPHSFCSQLSDPTLCSAGTNCRWLELGPPGNLDRAELC